MLFKPYPIWGSPANPPLDRAPTANPPPQFVYGALNYELQNTGTDDIPAPYNLSIHNAGYSWVVQVGNMCSVACFPERE